MNFVDVFKNKTIRIPLLQRDYVQGGKESIISPFIDSLVDENHASDLNYIYGYTEQGCFVPIDGQQRLTTLWLLYLYSAARLGRTDDFPIDFTFLSREYADDFCKRLKNKLQDVLSKMSRNIPLDIAIREQYWYLNSWNKNASVRNMLLALRCIHRKCVDKDEERLWQHLMSDNSITFAFLDMSESNGLDDDIYVKMNGRGRPLSIFENLKSWMDERIQRALEDNDEAWLHLWKKNIDNRWTQFFWVNRNRNQSHPEEIDDEQLFCFCNLLILYWMKDLNGLKDNIRSIRNNDPYLFEQLLLLFPQSNESDSEKEVMNYLFDNIRKGEMPSLTWIERLGLMPLGFLYFAFTALNKLFSIYPVINEMEMYFGGTESDILPIYDLSLSEGSYGRTLPLLYAILLVDDEKNAKEWMRECRNLILNTEIGKEKLPNVLANMDAFAEKVKQSTVYDVMKSYSNSIDDFLSEFSKPQIVEERKKANLDATFYPQMEQMENERFFSGRIYILFRLVKWEDEINKYSLDDFIVCSKILMSIFYAKEGYNGGIRPIYDTENERLLRRSLMSLPPFYYGLYRNAYWCFCANIDEWRALLNGVKTEIESLRKLIIDHCLPAVKKSGSNIEDTIMNCMRGIIKKSGEDYEKKVELGDGSDKFHLHFIHHVGVWNYMSTSRCDWRETDNHGLRIFLKTSNGNNSGRMELRSYSLYLDYIDSSVREDMKADREGWDVSYWPRERTCMFFEINDTTLNRKVVVDVFHYCRKENDYSLNVFLRPTNDEDNDASLCVKNNQNYFKAIFEKMSINMHMENESGRFLPNDTYSRSEIILLLRRLLPTIRQRILERK
jgi:hypothetical protein